MQREVNRNLVEEANYGFQAPATAGSRTSVSSTASCRLAFRRWRRARRRAIVQKVKPRLVQRESDPSHHPARPIQYVRRAATAENHKLAGIDKHLGSESLTPPGFVYKLDSAGNYTVLLSF